MTADAHAGAAGMRDHWWYRGRRTLVSSLLLRVRPPAGPVLDFGCGTGHMGAVLARHGSVHGVDASADAVRLGDHSAYSEVACADSMDHAAMPEGPFAVISCLDVIEHVEHDGDLLRSLCQRLLPGGMLIVSPPLWPDLFSEVDRAAGHFRRYTPESLKAVLEAAGLVEVARTGYVVALLPLARWHRRRIIAKRAVPDGEMAVPGALANAILSLIAIAEGTMVRWFGLPPGLSLFVVTSAADGSEDTS